MEVVGVISTAVEVGDRDGCSVFIDWGRGEVVGVTKLLICLPDVQEDKKIQNVSIYLAPQQWLLSIS